MGRPAWATDPSTWERAKTKVRREYGINSGSRFDKLAESAYLDMGGRTNRLGFGKSETRLVLFLEKARAGLVKKKVPVKREEGPTKEEFRWVRPGEDPTKVEEAKPEEEEEDDEEAEDEEGLEEAAEEETEEDAAKAKDLEMVIPEHEDAEVSAAEEADIFSEYPDLWEDPENLTELQTETKARFLNPLLPKIAKIAVTGYDFVFHAQPKKAEVDALLKEIMEKGLTGEIKNKLINAFSAQWFNFARGKKVALVNQSCSRCPRGQWTQLQSAGSTCNGSCYGGGCYVTKEQGGEAGEKRKAGLEKGERLTIHYTSENVLRLMAEIAHYAGHFIRDNQNSDGSVSMTVKVRDKRNPKAEPESILRRTLRVMQEHAEKSNWEEKRAPDYVVISSCYARPDDDELSKLAKYENLVVHVTVSGWHSKSETMHRLREFERYKKAFDAYAKANGKPGARVALRLVTKKAWSADKAWDKGEDRAKSLTKNDTGKDNGAQLQDWLIDHLKTKKYDVLWTPFHIQSKFAGSKGHAPKDNPVSLRQLAFDVSQEERKEKGQALLEPPTKKKTAGAQYAKPDADVKDLINAQKKSGAEFGTCCQSGRCKSCEAKCFSKHSKTQDPKGNPEEERKHLLNMKKLFETDLASRGEDVIKTPLQQHLNVLSALYANYTLADKKGDEDTKEHSKERTELVGEFRKWKAKITPILEEEVPNYIAKQTVKWKAKHGKDNEPDEAQTAKWRERYLNQGLSGASNLVKAEEEKKGKEKESPFRGLVDAMLAPYGMSHNAFMEGGVVSLGLSHDEKSLIHSSCRQVGPGAGLDNTSEVISTLGGTKLEKAKVKMEPRLVLKAFPKKTTGPKGPGKGKAQVGEVRDWQGGKFKKVREGEWQPVEAGKGKGKEGPADKEDLAKQSKVLQQKQQAAKVVANIATTVTDKVMDKMRQLYEGTLVERTLQEGEELGEKGKKKLLEGEKGKPGEKKPEEGATPKEEAEESDPSVPEEEPEILKPKKAKGGKAEARAKKTEKRVKGKEKPEAKHEGRLKRKKETDAKLRGVPEKAKKPKDTETEKVGTKKKGPKKHHRNPYGESMRRG